MIPNSKRIYLCTPDKKILAVLNGIQTDTVDFHPQIKGYSDLSFTVDRYISVSGQYIESNGYEDLKTYMYLYLEDIGYFQMQAPEVENDGNREVKIIQAYSAEKEFENKDLVGLKINTGENDSYEMLLDDNVGVDNFAKEYVTMFNPDKPKLSFLHIMIEKLPWWSIGFVDEKIKDAKIPFLDIDNMNIYAIMTSEVAPRLSCLFIFDYLNYQINVIHKDSLDLDTGIFISFRNLEQNVSVTVNEDSVFTRFTVAGDDGLNLRYHNYGSDQIIDLHYFLGEPYMDEELATKIENWLEFRDANKPQYIEKAKEVAALQEKYDDLMYTVPADQAYWKNWSGMRKDGLEKNLEYYNGLLTLFQQRVDPRPDEEKYLMENGEYVLDEDGNKIFVPKKNDSGEVDHEWYRQLLYDLMDKYSGYYTYVEICDYIIPYIQLALDNYGKPDWQKEDPEDRDIEDPTEHWNLYGYYELDGVRQSYEEDLVTSLDKYSKAWNEMTEEERTQKELDYLSEEGYNKTAGRVKYLHYVECLYGGGTIEKDAEGHDKTDPDKNNRKIVDHPGQDSIYYRLYELDKQIAEVEQEIQEIETLLGEYNNVMRYDVTEEELAEYTHIDSFIIDARRELLLTNKEIRLVSTLFHDTDYTNSNIFTTSIDTVYTTIDKEGELYEDAANKLYEVSEPQFNFSVSVDNFLRLTEYESLYDLEHLLYPYLENQSLNVLNDDNFNEKFGLLRFIRLGIRDDFFVKVRVIGYRWNPCEVTPELTLEFSNMISSKSGRSDLIQLLDQENNVGSKNSISIGTGNSKNDQDYVLALLEVLTKNSIFTKSVTEIVNNTTGQVDASQIQDAVNGAVGNLDLSNLSVKIGNITGTDAEFESVISKYISSDVVYTRLLSAGEAKIEEVLQVGHNKITEITGDYVRTATIYASQIDATEASFETLVADIIRVGEDGITEITEDAISTATITANQIKADDAAFETLVANIITVGEEGITRITEDTISTATINATQITGESGDFDTLATNIITAGEADIKDLIANNITVDMIQGESGEFNQFFINHLDVNEVFGDSADFSTLVSDLVDADTIVARLANLSQANISTLFGDNAFFRQLTTIANTSVTSMVDDQYVLNLIAGKIVADDITSGSITLNEDVKILSENGLLQISGTALQISKEDSDGNLYTAVQLGYDASDTPSLILRNENGNIIISPDGITQDAIADGLIINNMVADHTLGKAKMGWNVVEGDENGNIQITQILSGEDNFGALYQNFTTETKSNIDDLNHVSKYRIDISSSNGNTFYRNKVDCILSCRVYQYGDEITNSLQASQFTWSKSGGTLTEDAEWSVKNGIGKKEISISSEDIKNNTTIYCTVTIDSVNYTGSFIISLVDEIYTLYIDAPNGKNLRGNNITLNAVLFRNNIDVTDEYEDINFIWERHSTDSYGDLYWNNAHSNGSKSITITGNDVKIEADFECRFEVNGISVTNS